MSDAGHDRDGIAAELATATASLTTLTAEAAGLRTELTHTKDELTAATTQIHDLETTNNDLTVRLTSLLERIGEAESDVAAMRLREQANQTELEEYKIRQAQFQVMLDQLAKEKKDLETRVGGKGSATLEGLRSAKAESDRVRCSIMLC